MKILNKIILITLILLPFSDIFSFNKFEDSNLTSLLDSNVYLHIGQYKFSQNDTTKWIKPEEVDQEEFIKSNEIWIKLNFNVKI